LLQLAIENAEEGCVKETFGAALAVMQAANASDGRIRRMMRRIASDELRHAALSWRLNAWLDARLDAKGRARVARARRRTFEALRHELARADGELPDLGLPDSSRALAVLDAMRPALVGGDLAA
jgi:hypothetical protein